MKPKMINAIRLHRCILGFFLCIFSAFLSSCASKYPLSEVAKSSGATFTPPKGKALIYVYRPSKFIGMALHGRIWIDGQEVAQLNNGTFVAIPVNPRTYSIQAGGPFFSTYDIISSDFPEVKIAAKAGGTYFIRQNVFMGSSSSYLLQTGGAPIPVVSGEFFFRADMTPSASGRVELSKLKQVGSSSTF